MNLPKLADWVRTHLYEAHRGSFVEQGMLIVFDNGGVQADETIHQLELVLAWIRKKGFTVEGLASGSGGQSWVIVANPGDADLDLGPVEEMLWMAWRKVNGAEKDAKYRMYKAAQHQSALETILDRPRLPKGLLTR